MTHFLDMSRANLTESDPDIAALLSKESCRLNDGLELIASENVASPAVLAALSSVLSNKYAEGYPGRRYYGGCEFNDEVERIAIERVKKIFGAEHANVQPHSGAQANHAVFLAMLQPGDAFLGMDLSHGGHLTHGSPVNFSGLYYQAHSYGVNAEGFIDYEDKAVFPGLQGGPLMHVIGAKAVSFGEILHPSFKVYAEQVVSNARTLAHSLMEQGIKLVSSGTDNHLMLLDLRDSPLSGKDAEHRLAQIELTVNKNSVPHDPRKPMVTSGVRIGTPAVTTRGLMESDMKVLAKSIGLALQNDDTLLSQAKELVTGLCKKYPLYHGVLAEHGYVFSQK